MAGRVILSVLTLERMDLWIISPKVHWDNYILLPWILKPKPWPKRKPWRAWRPAALPLPSLCKHAQPAESRISRSQHPWHSQAVSLPAKKSDKPGPNAPTGETPTPKEKERKETWPMNCWNVQLAKRVSIFGTWHAVSATKLQMLYLATLSQVSPLGAKNMTLREIILLN